MAKRCRLNAGRIKSCSENRGTELAIGIGFLNFGEHVRSAAGLIRTPNVSPDMIDTGDGNGEEGEAMKQIISRVWSSPNCPICGKSIWWYRASKYTWVYDDEDKAITSYCSRCCAKKALNEAGKGGEVMKMYPISSCFQCPAVGRVKTIGSTTTTEGADIDFRFMCFKLVKDLQQTYEESFKVHPDCPLWDWPKDVKP